MNTEPAIHAWGGPCLSFVSQHSVFNNCTYQHLKKSTFALSKETGLLEKKKKENPHMIPSVFPAPLAVIEE